MILIDGKKISEQVKEEVKKEVAQIIDAKERPPHLAAILVGNDPASETYVNSKHKNAEKVGITSSVYNFPADISKEELFDTINFLNTDPEVDGFIVQLPLPEHINDDEVISAINHEKDIDGFHPINIGRMTQGLPAYLPATPAGIVELIKRSNIKTEGKHCVVLGRSNIVGTPISILMSRKEEFANSTVTLCHSRTKNLSEITKQADIIIAAIGKPEFLTGEMVKDNVTVIDVGIHRVKSDKTKSGYKLIGDVHFESVAKKASNITPVPGGVGPMTIAMLLKNTLLARKNSIYK